MQQFLTAHPSHCAVYTYGNIFTCLTQTAEKPDEEMNVTKLSLWSRHFTKLCKLVYRWESVSEINLLERLSQWTSSSLVYSTCCTMAYEIGSISTGSLSFQPGHVVWFEHQYPELRWDGRGSMYSYHSIMRQLKALFSLWSFCFWGTGRRVWRFKNPLHNANSKNSKYYSCDLDISGQYLPCFKTHACSYDNKLLLQ